MTPECFSILLIEDNPGDQRLIKEMLVGAKHARFDLKAVARLTDGLADLAQCCYDVILLDLSLPDSQGLNTFGTLHAEVPKTPIVVLSAINDETTAVRAVHAGAQDYLIKGQVDGQLLVRSLRYAIERARLENERAQILAREKEARSEAEAANRAKDEFLAIVSHELRTPLSAMLGWSRMLRSGKLDPVTFARAIESIERNAKTQTHLIEDLLDISRITTGQLKLNVSKIEPILPIKAAIDVLMHAAEAKDIRLVSSLDTNAGLIMGDPDRLQQIVWNLLSNAIKFTPPGGRVEVRLVRTDSQIEITVSDTGKGIDPEFLPYIFDRFRQDDSSSRRKFGGLGLGLAIVRNLVELHGGTVQAESGGENEGSTFIVRLPLLPIPVELTAVPNHSPNSRLSLINTPAIDGVRVLLVDDNADFRDLITTILQRCKAEVLAVATANEALEAIEKWNPDIMLSEIAMPGMDGISLIQKVRTLGPQDGGNIPAAAITAFAQVEDRMRALKAGFQVHLPKPVEPADLITVVANLVGRLPETAQQPQG